MDTVMSLTTGIISGIVSGWLVTEYYRKVDKRKEEREKDHNIMIYLHGI